MCSTRQQFLLVLPWKFLSPPPCYAVQCMISFPDYPNQTFTGLPEFLQPSLQPAAREGFKECRFLKILQSLYPGLEGFHTHQPLWPFLHHLSVATTLTLPLFLLHAKLPSCTRVLAVTGPFAQKALSPDGLMAGFGPSLRSCSDVTPRRGHSEHHIQHSPPYLTSQSLRLVHSHSRAEGKYCLLHFETVSTPRPQKPGSLTLMLFCDWHIVGIQQGIHSLLKWMNKEIN